MIKAALNDKDLLSEYGFYTASVDIGLPKVQTKFVEVPTRDGSIDISNVLSDAVRYEDRTIKIVVLRIDGNESAFAKLAHDILGQRAKITFDNDIGYYYLGRVSISPVKRANGAISATITATCDPFKYDVAPSDVDWEWDTFDLVNGVINEAGGLVINGTTSFTLICKKKREFPTFTASADVTLNYKGDTYTIREGTHKLYNLFFDEGENVLEFTGNATVSITYIGGSL